jgi:hypothetical protein
MALAALMCVDLCTSTVVHHTNNQMASLSDNLDRSVILSWDATPATASTADSSTLPSQTPATAAAVAAAVGAAAPQTVQPTTQHLRSMLQRRSLSTLLVCSALCANTVEATAAAAKLRQHLAGSGAVCADQPVLSSSSSTSSSANSGYSNGTAVQQLSSSMQALTVQRSSGDYVQRISERCWQVTLACAAALTAAYEAAAAPAAKPALPAAKPAPAAAVAAMAAAAASSTSTRAGALMAAATAMKQAAGHALGVSLVRSHAFHLLAVCRPHC